MKNLLLEQRGPHGALKTWRIRSEGRPITFGSSKHADLRSPDTSVRGIQGFFAYEDGEWKYFALNLTHENMNESVETSLSGPTEIKMGTTMIAVKPFEDRENIVTALNALPNEKTAKNKFPFQLFTVSKDNVLLETRLMKIGDTFSTRFDASHTKLKAQNSSQWMNAEIGPILVSQRTVYLSSDAQIRKFNGNAVLGTDEKLPVIATIVGMGILALLFLISPSSQNAGEVAMSTLPPAEYRQMKLAPAKKQKLHAVQKAVTVEPEASAAAAEKSPVSALSAIKNLGGSSSRLSKLLGKVSAAAGKSSHVIVSPGIVAGTGPSGKALSALGHGDQAGKDWGSESQGTSIKVSTLGVAGGKGTGGMGNLATGKTGTGGAELLEDESEIVGGLDRDIIAGVIRSQLGQILYCYERQLSASPDLYGKVAVRFTIGPKGEVETQRIGDSTLRNATVEGCILQKVARWKFPAPEGGTKVNVTYPFLFKSTN